MPETNCNCNHDSGHFYGIMKRSHPDSKFVVRDLMHGPCELNPLNPAVYVGDEESGELRPIVVLQVMQCAGTLVLIEFLETE